MAVTPVALRCQSYAGNSAPRKVPMIRAYAISMLPGLPLGAAPDSLFHPGGNAIVVHANPDDNKTDPAGNAGARIACGVVEKP